MLLAAPARAAKTADREHQEPPVEGSLTERAEARVARERAEFQAFDYLHWFGSLAMGRGLRFNNPYRLERVLGKTPESLSLSALYFDAAAGVAQGDPTGLQHGLSMHLAVALTGIRQEVLTPSYRLLFRPKSAWLWTLRLGVPVVLEPDVTLGAELGAGAVWHFLAGLGIYGELIGSLFFGAATPSQDRTTIPMVSAQLGVWVDYEVFE